MLRLQGQEKQYEILLQAVEDADASAQRELDAIVTRQSADQQRLAAQQAKIQVFTQQLAQTSQTLTELEGRESETVQATNELSERMTHVKTQSAAMEAERSTALAHIEDLKELQRSLEGDRQQKLSVVEAMNADTARLQEQIEDLKQRQETNRNEIEESQSHLKQVMTDRMDTEAAKTKAERLSQEKSKDILNMERACALLEQKKMTTAMEERQIIDKLWDNYELTPGTASEKRGQIESIASGNRRIAELKRKISGLGTPNLGAIEEFARVNERYSYLASQRDDVLTSKRELESIIKDITQEGGGR